VGVYRLEVLRQCSLRSASVRSLRATHKLNYYYSVCLDDKNCEALIAIL